jgi:crossover junction endodeoxyribonuclease RuvC
MRVAGLDLSLTATGIADDDGVATIKVALVAKASDEERIKRLHRLTCLIDRRTRLADLVVIEGHSFNSRNTQAHSLGELHGVVKIILWQRSKPFVLVAPAILKQYAAGKGNATKEEVLVAAARINPDIRTSDEADAWWLRHMAIAYYKHQPSSKLREAVLGRIRWPSLEWKEQ